MNKHNPLTATYYLLIKKYDRNTDQKLFFGKFTRDKRLQDQGKTNEPNKTPLTAKDSIKMIQDK